MKEEVKEYIKLKMEELAVQRIFKGGDVSGFKDAKDVLNYAFQSMEREFGKQNTLDSSDIPEYE